jgi:protoporphyrinogen/coproporphyrinogen III oxidase
LIKSPPLSRFLYLSSRLIPLPSFQILTRLLPPIITEPFFPSNRKYLELEDESVDAFLTRRFGESFARTFGSALVHGIYAADSRELSVRAAFPTLWNAEDRGGGSVVRGFLKRQMGGEGEEKYDLGDVERNMAHVGVYSFKDGIEALTHALTRYLKACPNVTLFPGVAVESLGVNEDRSFRVISPFFFFSFSLCSIS